MWQNACVQGKRAKDTEFGAQEAFLHTVSRCPHGCVRTRRQEEVGFQDSTAGAKKKGRNGDGVWGEGEGGMSFKNNAFKLQNVGKETDLVWGQASSGIPLVSSQGTGSITVWHLGWPVAKALRAATAPLSDR